MEFFEKELCCMRIKILTMLQVCRKCIITVLEMYYKLYIMTQAILKLLITLNYNVDEPLTISLTFGASLS